MLRYILAFLLLCSTAYADINLGITDSKGTVQENNLFEPFTLIVLDCQHDVDEFTETTYDWKMPEGLNYVELGNGKSRIVTGQPGTYNIGLVVILKHKRLVTILKRDPDFPNDPTKATMEDIYVIDRAEIESFSEKFTIDGEIPTPTPVPIPDPDPKPDPVPADDIIPEPGFNVMIIEETSERPLLDPSQTLALQSVEPEMLVRGYNGFFRQADQHSILANEDPKWAKAMKRERTSLPWIVISNDKKWFEGPLPKTLDETLNLIKQYKPE